jgi:aspartyl-tRNA(Asn)/glutamyl-tRNA(Gln) amidotransferase subunit A
MIKTELHWKSVAELSKALGKSEISPVELTEYYLARIAEHNEELHAYKFVTAERALEAARAAEKSIRIGEYLGPLHGIPYCVKDVFDVEGLPTTAGSRLLNGNIATANATVVQRMIDAGMVLLGKTHMVQFAYGGVGINHDDPTPNNPWVKAPHIAGGSSSGSGVAVAGGLAPISVGTDTGGSVRIPSALCGITGLKTTVGQVSTTGVFPLSWTLDSVGPLAKSVEDAALLYDIIRGADVDDPVARHGPNQDPMTRLREGVKGLRLAIAENVFWQDADPQVECAVRDAAQVFVQLGANVETIPFEEAAMVQRLDPRLAVAGPEAYTVNRDRLENHFDECDPIVANRMMSGGGVKATDYIEAKIVWKELREKAYTTLKDVDALLVPTTAIPALPIAHVDATLETYAKYNSLYLRNTIIGNILDLCGLSVPCGMTEQGLPIGLMIYGKPRAEALVLRIGYAFQQATDWHLKRPGT